MNTGLKALVGIVILLVLGIAGYVGYSKQQTRAQQQVVIKAVTDATAQLREALAKTPTPELLAQLEASVQAVKAPRDRALADAAELYIIGAREIARRRADAGRLSAEAATARKALASHMANQTRAASWYNDATRMKTRVEQLHNDLGRTLKALDELLATMPDAEKRLAAQVAQFGSSNLLLDAATRDAARKQVQDELAQAAAELEKTRQLLPR